MLLLPLLALLTGCATVGTFQTADTLGTGAFQVGLEPSWWGVAATGEAAGFLHGGVSARYGVNDRLDVGGRIGSSGLEMLFKVQLTDPQSGGPIVSIAPSGGGFGALGAGGGAGLLAFQVPVILGFPTSGGSQFVLAPKVHEYLILAGTSDDSASLSLTSLGASVGYAARLGPGFRLLPEVAFVYPVLGAADASDQSSQVEFLGEGVLLQVGLGILLGE
ncbi:MAG: hypothetical protein JXB39_11420 [Deltaproteobacteria bacterium]|nr:hypothetical protein [Deltaproteobacteria bacterium]